MGDGNERLYIIQCRPRKWTAQSATSFIRASLDFSFSLLHFIVNNLNNVWNDHVAMMKMLMGLSLSRSHQCSITDSVYECLLTDRKTSLWLLVIDCPQKHWSLTNRQTHAKSNQINCLLIFFLVALTGAILAHCQECVYDTKDKLWRKKNLESILIFMANLICIHLRVSWPTHSLGKSFSTKNSNQ